MRILITGSNGLLGQKLTRALGGGMHELDGFDLQATPFLPGERITHHQQDITSGKATLEAIRRLEPDLIIHAAAMTNVDRCETEKETCWNANVRATETIARAARKCGSRLIYISTDYVFDGEAGPYNEEAIPNPLSYYGKSKLGGENAVRGSGADWTIIRTIVLYGAGVGLGASFLTWLLRELRAGKPVSIVTDQWGNMTIADDLAAAIERVVQLDKRGLFHMGGKGYMTRFEFALRAARFFGQDESLIKPVVTADLKMLVAKRPMKSGLATEKAERELYYQFQDFDAAMRSYQLSEREIPS